MVDVSHLNKAVSSHFEENSEFAPVPELHSPQSLSDPEVPGESLWFYDQLSIPGHCNCDHPAVSQKTENQSTSRPINTTLGHFPK